MKRAFQYYLADPADHVRPLLENQAAVIRRGRVVVDIVTQKHFEPLSTPQHLIALFHLIIFELNKLIKTKITLLTSNHTRIKII